LQRLIAATARSIVAYAATAHAAPAPPRGRGTLAGSRAALTAERLDVGQTRCASYSSCSESPAADGRRAAWPGRPSVPCVDFAECCAETNRPPTISSSRDRSTGTAEIGPPPGPWYQRLIARKHLPPPDVGPVPYSHDSGAWLSAVDDPEPTPQEFKAFYDRASTVVERFGAERLREITDRPYLGGDYFGYRSEELLFNRTKLSARAAEIGDLLFTLQNFLRLPENVRWRLGYFEDDDSLVVYPSTIVIGQHRVPSNDLVPVLQSWLLRSG